MTLKPSIVTREAGASQPAGRRSRRRVSASHVLIALAVVLAFVLNILALQDRNASVLVAVVERPIPSGSVLSADMVRLVPMHADFAGLDSLVTDGDLPNLLGSVVSRALGEGAVLDLASVAPAGSASGMRAMSLPVEESRAAGGSLVSGDRVDVIAVFDGTPQFVVTDAEVIAVPAVGSGSFGGTDFYVVVGVDAPEALALAQAMAAGRIDVVRSTGAPAVGAVSDGPGS